MYKLQGAASANGRGVLPQKHVRLLLLGRVRAGLVRNC